MLDYKALTCLHAVLQFQSFEKAAQHLNLTQSAVSQSIKRLEQECGRPLLIRARPVVATPLGEILISHINKVTLLEENLQKHLTSNTPSLPLSIAVNNDVLATWFIQVVNEFSKVSNTKLHIKSADQTQTRSLLQKGEVVTCISQTGTPVAGGNSLFLGNMRYELFATPSFIETYLQGNISPEAIQKAPSLIYDEHDELWVRYQNECLELKEDVKNSHWYPSSHGFVELVLGGTVCALIPRVQVKKWLESGELISLLPDKSVNIPLYWHWYKLDSLVLEQLTKIIVTVTKDALY